MLGRRLAEARKAAGLLQIDLAVALGDRYDQSVIAHVERGDITLRYDGLVRAAQELHVSLDYLAGLTDDPTPPEERANEEKRKREELESALQQTEEVLNQLRAKVNEASPFVPATEATDDEVYESVQRYEHDVRLAAGLGVAVDHEPIPGEIKFRKSWLQSHGLKAINLMLVDVIGDSMLPTIQNGDSALADESRRHPLRNGRIYALRTTDGPLVKRLRKRRGRWWADSDNDKYKPRLIRESDETIGLVVWWAHTER